MNWRRFRGDVLLLCKVLSTFKMFTNVEEAVGMVSCKLIDSIIDVKSLEVLFAVLTGAREARA